MNLSPAAPNAGPVLFYESQHYYLSNFSAFAIRWQDRLWMTSEHAYQAAKFLLNGDRDLAHEVGNCLSAHDALMTARRLEKEGKFPGWDDGLRLETMASIVQHKFDQHPWIQRKLLETGDRVLTEASHKDAFWGWGPNGDGRNELGKIWMTLRAAHRQNLAAKATLASAA